METRILVKLKLLNAYIKSKFWLVRNDITAPPRIEPIIPIIIFPIQPQPFAPVTIWASQPAIKPTKIQIKSAVVLNLKI